MSGKYCYDIEGQKLPWVDTYSNAMLLYKKFFSLDVAEAILKFSDRPLNYRDLMYLLNDNDTRFTTGEIDGTLLHIAYFVEDDTIKNDIEDFVNMSGVSHQIEAAIGKGKLNITIDMRIIKAECRGLLRLYKYLDA